MEVIQTFPNGTTIEAGVDSHGNQVHRVCCPTKAMCRYVEPIHCAQAYAQQYEEYYSVKPEKT
jgi:hypothetical protein